MWICRGCALGMMGWLAGRGTSASRTRLQRSLNFSKSQRGYEPFLPSTHVRQASRARTFASTAERQDAEEQPASQPAKRAGMRGKRSSLRRTAVEAQRSRDFIRGTGRRLFLDPGAVTKDITASCAAEQYDLHIARKTLEKDGYDIDPHDTGLFPQVLHVHVPPNSSRGRTQEWSSESSAGDVFIFPSGSVVSWNVPEKLQKHIVRDRLKHAAIGNKLQSMELEDMEYIEDTTRDTSKVVGDAIVLGTQTGQGSESAQQDGNAAGSSSSEVDLVLAKIAFSSGIARSTKLAVLENLLNRYFESTKNIPSVLSAGSKLRVTRSFILQKTGELLSIRAQLNLYGELTDTMPDLFWDSPSQLGLSDYYDQVGKALDVNARIRTLNEKMDYASEIASVLRERLSEKHSAGLEWLIIFLISIEVGFGLLHLYRDYQHARDEESTEALLKEWLERELKAKKM